MNTNGSLPSVLAGLFDAGLDSIRVSMNSVRKPFYEAYFRPNGYRFSDIVLGIAESTPFRMNIVEDPGTDMAAR